MKRIGILLAFALLAGACSDAGTDAPPSVHLGDSICEHCGMIISDERFAGATIVSGPRGDEARLFDDYNCQIQDELSRPDVVVEARWVHDHDTRAWLRAPDATFLASPQLHTPMASQVAAFSSMEAAREAGDELGGELLTFDELRDHFADQ